VYQDQDQFKFGVAGDAVYNIGAAIPAASFPGWFTLRLQHEPSLNKVTARVYSGRDTTFVLNQHGSKAASTSFPGPVRFGFGADADAAGAGQFARVADLRVISS
jgi:hypothetical protein